ncbi:ArsR/SmtB family transcription factor [Actinomadura livida]|uniref:ArsR family transcriptional regulator n=1 Tax=Actinomadura livida TaxID=79909 RepID=A0A7W7MYB9_9ACTN|nr:MULTISPECIES: metalloregulator ArsR/SmtB family transcription factor [Actinomadura]MBB4774650.1 ArsR family transcriptional regulator [Actinomadura catellatispora]GGU06905.1 transcriptional regulator [Actinomadura livida]
MSEVVQGVDLEVLRALSSRARLDILRWLKNPAANFGHQAVGDFDVEGVCVSVIQERAGMSQPTVSAHLKVLHQAGLVTRKKVGAWQYYKRDEAAIRAFTEVLAREL